MPDKFHQRTLFILLKYFIGCSFISKYSDSSKIKKEKIAPHRSNEEMKRLNAQVGWRNKHNDKETWNNNFSLTQRN